MKTSKICLLALFPLLAACQQAEIKGGSETTDVELVMQADVPGEEDGDKTYLSGGRSVLWGSGEYVMLYYNDGAATLLSC